MQSNLQEIIIGILVLIVFLFIAMLFLFGVAWFWHRETIKGEKLAEDVLKNYYGDDNEKKA